MLLEHTSTLGSLHATTSISNDGKFRFFVEDWPSRMPTVTTCNGWGYDLMKRWALAFGACAMLSLLREPALADGQVRIVQSDGASKIYPGVTLVNTAAFVGLRDDSAHQTLIVQKGGCKNEGGMQVCSGSALVWDRYGVQTPIDVASGSVFVNTSSKTLRIPGTRVSLTPNTLDIEITTQKGTHISAFGFIDSTVAAQGI